MTVEGIAVFQQGQDEFQVLAPPCQLAGGSDDMDRIFGSGFGSQKFSEPLPPEAQLEPVPIDNHLGDHRGYDVMRFLAIIEVVRQRFGTMVLRDCLRNRSSNKSEGSENV